MRCCKRATRSAAGPMSTPAILAPYPSGTPRIATVLFPFVLTVKLLTTQIETAATAALTREERLEQTRERREITRLNQKLARSVKLRDDSLVTHHTAKEPGRRLPQRVLRRSFPGHEMTCVDDVTLTRLEPLAMNRAKRCNEQ